MIKRRILQSIKQGFQNAKSANFTMQKAGLLECNNSEFYNAKGRAYRMLKRRILQSIKQGLQNAKTANFYNAQSRAYRIIHYQCFDPTCLCISVQLCKEEFIFLQLYLPIGLKKIDHTTITTISYHIVAKVSRVSLINNNHNVYRIGARNIQLYKTMITAFRIRATHFKGTS